MFYFFSGYGRSDLRQGSASEPYAFKGKREGVLFKPVDFSFCDGNSVFCFSAFGKENSKVPFLSRGLPLWITLASLFFAVVLKRKKAVVIPTVCICYLLTLFLGPLAVIRYALPVLALAPVLVFGLFNREDSQKLQ